MSSFIMLQNQQQQGRIERSTKKRVKRRVKGDSESHRSSTVRSTISSSSDNSNASSILNRYTSMPSSSSSSVVPAISPLQNNSPSVVSLPLNTNQMIMFPDENYKPYHEREKKLFDPDTSRYVLKPIKLSPLETKISEYEKAFMSVKMFRYHQRNLTLNQQRSLGENALFSSKNLNFLRYSYFKEFTNHHQIVQYRVSLFKPNGEHKLRYMRKVAKISESAARPSNAQNITGLPSLTNDEEDEEMLTDEESEDESDETVGFFTQGQSRRDQQLAQQLNVRNILKSAQFWHNVYQDIKLHSFQEPGAANYFELLPSMNQARNFFSEVLDYTLYHISQLNGDCTNLQSASDIQLIQNYAFNFFRDSDYDFFKLMAGVHGGMYDNRNAFINGQEEYNREVQGLLKVLAATVLENLKISTAVVTSKQNYDEVFGLWEQMLKFVIFELLGRKDLPSNVIFKSNYHCGDYKEMIAAAHAQQASAQYAEQTQAQRHESISSRSTASVMSARYNSMASSMSSHHHNSPPSNFSSKLAPSPPPSPDIHKGLEGLSISGPYPISPPVMPQLRFEKPEKKKKMSIFSKFRK